MYKLLHRAHMLLLVGCIHTFGPKAPPPSPQQQPLYELHFNETNTNQHIALTFDDGPDAAGNTEKILTILREKQLKATFFINATWLAYQQDPITYRALQQTVRRIVQEEHVLGNHGARHIRFTNFSESQLQDNIDLLEQDVADILDRPTLKLTLLRTPYGEPMYSAYRLQHPAIFERVANRIAKKAVHVAWTYDPTDWHATSPEAIVESVLQQIEHNNGLGGIVLLHSNTQHTVAALPILIDKLRLLHFQFTDCETLIRQKYGQTSYELIYGLKRAPTQ